MAARSQFSGPSQDCVDSGLGVPGGGAQGGADFLAAVIREDGIQAEQLRPLGLAFLGEDAGIGRVGGRRGRRSCGSHHTGRNRGKWGSASGAGVASRPVTVSARDNFSKQSNNGSGPSKL